MMNNDARFRSSSRSILTKKILKTLKKENPKRYWGFHGSVYGVLLILSIMAYFLLIEGEDGDALTSAYYLMGLILAAIPVIGYTGFKMFETYFSKYPEDFPND